MVITLALNLYRKYKLLSCPFLKTQSPIKTNSGRLEDNLSDITSMLKSGFQKALEIMTGPRSAVGNVSGYRCVSDCRSRGREFDPSPVPYFRGD